MGLEKASGTRESGKVKCPFYIGCAKEEIQCEGYCAGIRKTIIRFDREKTKKEYKEMCCEDDYTQCEICEVIRGKYGGKGLTRR